MSTPESQPPPTADLPRVTGVPSVPYTIELLAAMRDALGELAEVPEHVGSWLVLQTGNADWLTLPDEVDDLLKAWGWPWEVQP
jgi:hypothetical protein